MNGIKRRDVRDVVEFVATQDIVSLSGCRISMHIALYNLTTTTKYGGVESFVWDLARELANRGRDITIIGGHGARREAAAGVRVVTFPFMRRELVQRIPPLRRAYAEAKLLERLSLGLAALPHLLRSRYDIIHIQKPYDMGPALLARRLVGSRVILGCHGEDFYPGDRVLAKRVNGAVSCSRFNAKTIAKRYGFLPKVVFNGIDTTLFQPTAPDPYIQALRGAKQVPLLLWVGRFQPWKGVDVAIRALQHIPHAKLIIAGDGEQRSNLEQLTRDLGLLERVHFLGSVPRTSLPAIYSACDLVLATSFASETFGIGPVEAQACGIPVVASDFGGFPEVIDIGRTGLLYPPQDHNTLAATVMNLLNATSQRKAMAAAAPAWAAQFAWPAVADRVEEAYRASM
jgi:D-inositol-3-phosphate glycosyltransferase